MLAAAAAAASGNALRSASRSPDRHSFSDDVHLRGGDSGRKSPFSTVGRTRTNTDPDIHGNANADADSFMTARTSFVQLQNDGEALLGGRPAPDRDDPYHRARAATASPIDRTPAVYPHSDLVPAALHSRKRPQGLIGSIRRAIGAISTGGERSFSLTATLPSSTAASQPQDTDRSATSSPAKTRANVPRRAASDGGHLLRHKRGRKDWQSASAWQPYRDSDPDPGDWGPEPVPTPRGRGGEDGEDDEEGEEWDVERAAAQRDVQVMFTVPKTRLRVVNDDMDRASLRSSASDAALSRSASARTESGQGSRGALRAERSRNGLRTLSEGTSGVKRLGQMEEDGEEEGGEGRRGDGGVYMD